MMVNLEQAIALIENELVGFWKFKTIDECESNRRWCASINVNGYLIDTEDFPTPLMAVLRAIELVGILNKKRGI